ncbi:hypothetical protein [Streptomyces sp. NPDC019224]|uniref:hypothetical protein n=1 Tax=Streptomyces sp. NPDC019224 TaxID=3154484 RepID=UPI0033F53291
MRTRHRGLAASLLVFALGATAVAPAVAVTPSPAGDGPALTAIAPQLRLPAPGRGP